MAKAIDIEAEGKELIIENEFGDTVIIPKDKADWVKKKLEDGCYDCIDGLVATLPAVGDYAQSGFLAPKNGEKEGIFDSEGNPLESNSPEYLEAFNNQDGYLKGKDGKSYTRHASMDNPVYEIKSNKTDHVAYHYGRALTKI